LDAQRGVSGEIVTVNVTRSSGFDICGIIIRSKKLSKFLNKKCF
jgi:hypothetical protein